MRICIAGAGLSGLTAAFHLAGFPDVEVQVVEASEVFGGRANVTASGEHCARLFLDDYHELFGVLDRIPAPGGGSVRSSLRPVRRRCHSATKGWVEVSHLYPVLARELSVRERFDALWSVRRPRLLAQQVLASDGNRLGSRRNYSLRSQASLALSLFRSRSAMALEGPTDEALVLPWVEHVRAAGVVLRTEAPLTRLDPDAGGVTVEVAGRSERYDAVLLTLYVSDLVDVLDASGIRHGIRLLDHTHLQVLTLDLEPDEDVVREGGDPVLYSRFGITTELQPRAARAIAVCIRPESTDPAHVVRRVSEMLGLRAAPRRVRVRTNQDANEAIFMADYIDPDVAVAGLPGSVHVAGSWVRNSYPGDSGEGAARSARRAVERIVAQHGLVPR